MSAAAFDDQPEHDDDLVVEYERTAYGLQLLAELVGERYAGICRRGARNLRLATNFVPSADRCKGPGCSNELTGRQRLFCSPRCKKRYYRRLGRERDEPERDEPEPPAHGVDPSTRHVRRKKGRLPGLRRS
jgi:hypothetical protein